MRVDADVAAALRASGKGWQTRVNALLRQAVEQGWV
ncbi:MAG: BrnA antitoxin family protein [Rhodoferax sp.]